MLQEKERAVRTLQETVEVYSQAWHTHTHTHTHTQAHTHTNTHTHTHTSGT